MGGGLLVGRGVDEEWEESQILKKLKSLESHVTNTHFGNGKPRLGDIQSTQEGETTTQDTKTTTFSSQHWKGKGAELVGLHSKEDHQGTNRHKNKPKLFGVAALTYQKTSKQSVISCPKQPKVYKEQEGDRTDTAFLYRVPVLGLVTQKSNILHITYYSQK